MKKILFMVINMNVGGTEKALLNMIDELNKEEYDITILMLEQYGGFLEAIPGKVKIKFFDGFSNMKPILNNPPIQTFKNLIRERKFIEGINIITLHIITKILGERSLYFKYILRDYREIEEVYDIAVAYSGPMDFITYFIVNKINANRKVQWIHFDITKIAFNLKFAKRIYRKIDKIFIVSKEGKEKLIKKIPEFKNKTEVFLNIIAKEKVKKLSNEEIVFKDKFDGIRILTVGRLSKEKGQDMTISVLAKLKHEGYKVKWYCIGEGESRDDYEALIRKYNLEKDYFLLGGKSNPYPFMKECDIYVQSSRHEGYCITLAEAKIFNIPIVTTDFTGAKEQIENNKTGLISEINECDLYKKIKILLDDDGLRKCMINNLSNQIVSEYNGSEKINLLIDR